jgi:hypothetical protein
VALRILKQDVDGQTAATRFTVQVEETDSAGKITLGPVERIMIYPGALANLLGGAEPTAENMRRALKNWMQPRHAEAVTRKHMLEAVAKVAQEFAGQKLEFDE